MIKGYCGNCGEEITEDYIDNGKVICPTCHMGCWDSELLPLNYKKLGYMTMKEMRSRL
jgi:hypothetical protein